jgi:tetratricopeptide (TPR) repeat protein
MLDRVLSSETFKRSGRARSLLAYLVDREQAGDAEKLKGYAIAVDVFGKDAAFDASTDALVRVQAGRLRELLSHYYQNEGEADPLRIAVPRGAYVPAYEAVPLPIEAVPQAPCEDGEQPSPTAPNPDHAMVEVAVATTDGLLQKLAAPLGQVRLLWSAFALIAALLVLFVYRSDAIVDRTATAAVAAPANPATDDPVLSASLPTIHILTRGDDPAVVSVARHFRAALAGFDTLEMLAADYAPTGGGGAAADASGFVLAIAGGDPSGSVSIDLQSLGSGKVLLNRLLSPAQTRPEAVEDQVASIATSIAPVTGVIYGYLKQNALNSGLVDCLSLNEAYYTDQTPVRHLAAYKCLEKLAAADVSSPLVFAELAGLHLEAKTDGYSYPSAPTEEQAMMLAREAVRLDPTSPYAHRAMGYLYARRGDTTESVRWMRKAYELNTYDLSMAASYGYALVFAADYATGAAILQRAVDASSAHPTWWDYSLFLARFMMDDMDEASHATDALLSPRKQHYLAARLIAAHWRGDERGAGSLANEIASAYPKFAADPAASLKAAKYPADLTVKFVGALRTAGLGGAS